MLCSLWGWWFGRYIVPVSVCPLTQAEALCSRHNTLLLVMGCCWAWKKLFLAGLLSLSLTHVFSAANHIASIIAVFIASLGVVRLTSQAAAKIDTSEQHNSLIPWKLLFSVWSYVSFLSPPHFLLKGRIAFYLQLDPGPVVCCFCMHSPRIIL